MKRTFIVIPLLCVLMLAACGKPDNTVSSAKRTPTNAKTASSQAITDSRPVGQSLVREIMKAGKQGLIPDCEFPVKTTSIEEVYKKWGEPGDINDVPAANGTFAIYWNKRIVIGFNKNSIVFDIRSYKDALKSIKLSDITTVLGSPESERQLNQESILVYPASSTYKMRFIFPQITRENPDPMLDHISLQYPQGNLDNTEIQ